MKSNRGLVLIFVLWVVAVLALLALSLASQLRQQAHVFKGIEDRRNVHYAVEGALKVAIDSFIKLDKKSPISWFGLRELSKAITDNNLGHSRYYMGVGMDSSTQNNIVHEIQNANQNQTRIDFNNQNKALYGIIDEQSKININKADRNTLIRLFEMAAGLKSKDAEKLANLVKDYRDADNHVSQEVGREGEAWPYKVKKLPYGPKNSDFEFISELLRIPGMTGEIYESIRAYLTVFGDGKVNLNTAPLDILILSGLSAEVSQRLVSIRAGEDEVLGTVDDVVFYQLSQIEALIDIKDNRLSEPEKLSLRHMISRRKASVRSSALRVYVRARQNLVTAYGMCVYHFDRGVQRWVQI